MGPNLRDVDLEATTRDKVLFLAMALPLLGAIGAALRVVAGMSERATLLVVLPLLCVGFVAWHLGIAIRRAHRSAAEDEHGIRRARDVRSTHVPRRRLHARPE